jgi:hypothetical protein
MKKLLTLVNLLLLAAVTLLAWLALSRAGVLPGFAFRSGSKPIHIDDTPVMVRQIRAIAQLLTQSYYSETVFDSGTIETPPFQANKRLILIAKGEVLAGFDLRDFNEASITRRGNTAIIALPAPRILDVIINPSGFETFLADGDIRFEERVQLQEQARNRFRRDIDKARILENSASQGRKIIEKFFRLMGFTDVEVVVGASISKNAPNRSHT